MNVFLSLAFLLEEAVNANLHLSIMLSINPLLNTWLLKMNYIPGTMLGIQSQ